MLTTVLAAAIVAALASPMSPSPTSAAPTEERIVAVVFANFSVRFHPQQGCNPEEGECTVGSFVEMALVSLAESEREAPKHSWERAECVAHEVDDAFIEWVGPPHFSPRLAARLAPLRGKRIWYCTLAWGFGAGADDTIAEDDTGEIWWSREVGFLLTDDADHPVIRHSFNYGYTP